MCLPLAYALENEGIPSRIFTINTIQPQVLCMIFSDLLKAQKKTSKPKKCVEVLEQTTGKILSQNSMLMVQLKFL